MESQYQHTVNGQEVTQADINLISKNGALADDRVLAELLRLAPYDGTNVAKVVLPFQVATVGPKIQQGLVMPGTGKVIVMPHRVVIGTRTAWPTDPVAWWRDIRSCLVIGSSASGVTQVHFANSAGGFRYDLVYLAVSVDNATATDVRLVKDPTTLVVAQQNLHTHVTTTASVGVVTGVENSGTQPALPNDTAGVYYVPLAYVVIPAGFVSGSTVLDNWRIWECSTVANQASAGVSVMRPADGQNRVDGAVQQHQAWTYTQRPTPFLPPTMIGTETLLIAMDLNGTQPTSHHDGDVVDASRNWDNRVFRWTAYGAAQSTTPHFAWEKNAAAPFVPDVSQLTANSKMVNGTGQTFVPSGAHRYVLALDESNPFISNSTAIRLYSSSGQLKVEIVGAPSCKVFIWLEASGQFNA